MKLQAHIRFMVKPVLSQEDNNNSKPAMPPAFYPILRAAISVCSLRLSPRFKVLLRFYAYPTSSC